MRGTAILAAAAGAALAARPATALGPHEILLLANENSTVSLAVAKQYARRRGVPPQNLVRLRVPLPAAGQPAQIGREEFTRLIWEPAQLAARQRGLAGHILAWVYSTDFPAAVRTQPVVSLQGLTFVRNRLPDAKDIEEGRYRSPLFAGPNFPAAPAHASQSFDALAEWLGAEMPLPSMTLGWTGERGNTLEEVLATLERGARSDGTRPTGTVYLVTGDDIRATCRQWQYPAAAAELARLGVRAVVGREFPAGQRDILGLMMGLADVNPAQAGGYLPGAFAEHLTSAAAIFHSANQTKLTAWIRAGATLSAGAVVEPYSIWTKFPSAWFFVHYAAGCTAMESFYQSIRCPLQLLLVGDPLAQPWARRAEVILSGLPQEPATGTFKLTARVAESDRRYWPRWNYWLDGRWAGAGQGLEVRAAELAEGRHSVRAVAYGAGLVRAQVFAEGEFVVARRER